MTKLSFQTLKQYITPSLPAYRKKVAQALYKSYAGLVVLKGATPCVQDNHSKQHLKGHLRPYQSIGEFTKNYRYLSKEQHPDAVRKHPKWNQECPDLQKARMAKLTENSDNINSKEVSKFLEKTQLWGLVKFVYLGLDADFKAGDSYQVIAEKYDVAAADHMCGERKLAYQQKLLEDIKSNMGKKGCAVSAPDQPTALEIKDCLIQHPDLQDSAKETVNEQTQVAYKEFLNNQLSDIVLGSKGKVELLQEEYNKVHAAGVRSYCKEYGGLCKILGESGVVQTDHFQNHILGELLPDGDVGVN